MLNTADIMSFVATKNAKRAREFYQKALGLTFVSEDPFAIVFDANGTMLRVQKVDELAPAKYTVLGWQVSDIGATVRELASRGVHFERFEGMTQDGLGIWTSPSGAEIAWFKDPDGNTLSLTEFEE
jgi:catechol 2,3-dioxygenase-like lactoylglutathione lyase family enzyme